MSAGLFAAIAGVIGAAIASLAFAHSASDAYLMLDATKAAASTASRDTVLHGQWDIALRDLDFVLSLDASGDGDITWAELRTRQRDIADYAYRYLRIADAGVPCTIRPTRMMVDDHADGAYAALFFDVTCPGRPQKIGVDYRLFFAIDPSHRGVFVFRSGAGTATALLSPETATIELPP
ncbi:MAG TPA: hypothetical protein VN858_00960 [Casimicrobiaceae bacterium]|nr:hypothetical protein [Casimicrobiaceae bacterium]